MPIPPRPSSMPPRPEAIKRTGTRVGKYDLVSELATGGMGSVWAARTGDGTFALKRLKKQLLLDAAVADRVFQAARAASKIRHANVVTIEDIIVNDGELCIVTELIQAETLRGLVKLATTHKMPISGGVALRIVTDALAGLSAGHAQSVVHGDLSPENVFVGADGVTKLLDFGLSRAFAGTAGSPAKLKDKVGYQAPEQLRPNAGVDARADLFGVGVLLWELLAGQRLFDSKYEAAIAQKVLTQPAPKLDELGKASPAIAAVVARALQIDPAGRFASAAEMAAALEAAAAGAIAPTADVAVTVDNLAGPQLAARRAALAAPREPAPPGFGEELPTIPKAAPVPTIANAPEIRAFPAEEPPTIPSAASAKLAAEPAAAPPPTAVEAEAHTSAPDEAPTSPKLPTAGAAAAKPAGPKPALGARIAGRPGKATMLGMGAVRVAAVPTPRIESQPEIIESIDIPIDVDVAPAVPPPPPAAPVEVPPPPAALIEVPAPPAALVAEIAIDAAPKAEPAVAAPTATATSTSTPTSTSTSTSTPTPTSTPTSTATSPATPTERASPPPDHAPSSFRLASDTAAAPPEAARAVPSVPPGYDSVAPPAVAPNPKLRKIVFGVVGAAAALALLAVVVTSTRGPSDPAPPRPTTASPPPTETAAVQPIPTVVIPEVPPAVATAAVQPAVASATPVASAAPPAATPAVALGTAPQAATAAPTAQPTAYAAPGTAATPRPTTGPGATPAPTTTPPAKRPGKRYNPGSI